MASPLAPTIGVWLMVTFIAALFQGMGMLQGFLYFVWHHNDHWWIKGTVITMLIVEAVQMGLAFSNCYTWLIDGFGDTANLDIIHWQDMAQLALIYISALIAQGYFARTIYHLDDKRKTIPIMIMLLALLACGAGLGQVAFCIELGKYSALGETAVTSNLQAAASLAADLLITGALLWRLNDGRSGIQSTNRVINFVIMTAINRGLCTMLLATLNVILFVTKPGTFYFMIAVELSDKLYMNSMLAMLNTREHARSLRDGTVIPSGGKQISMATFAARPTNSITMISTHEVHRDDDYMDGKRVMNV
ncbi:hypothetical protein DFH09DRAFT_1365535 [Mycena vulgaris]|nr:hypothetical protein DFH09DRAFT_288790 [Mycena vulgaris]KAJ6556854.1 hypothetical protein DFH09DRAFT_1365535 [Mycena vulgaris]